MKSFIRRITTVLLCLATAAFAQVSTYDGATGMLTIPAVKVGDATYVDVTLLNIGNYTFALQTAIEQTPTVASVSYDGTTGVLTIPAVRVGSTTYINVTLHNSGNYTFSLQAAPELPAGTLSGVTSFLGAVDALWANAVPASGALRYSLADNCLLDNGTTKAWLISDWDTNLQEQLALNTYRVGELRSNIQVLAVRDITNPDSSTREEVDVAFDTQYKDGSISVGDQLTLIRGSSAGTPGCTNPPNSTAWRNFGNQQLIQVAVRGRNYRDERYSLSTGAPLSPAVLYQRHVQFYIGDPMGNATYVIVTGPGPSALVNGVAAPFSLKFISPRLLRSAPELAGKPGNYLNWLDTDLFRYCRVSGSSVPVASIADCVNQGATANTWGWSPLTPDAAADAAFQSQGWVAGGTYAFAVYNDEGWKTVNGHVGRTPVAMYLAVLKNLPYTFVEMAGSGVNADKFPRISFGLLVPAQVRVYLFSSTPIPINLAWTAIPGLSDGRTFRLFRGWEYFQGPQAGNASGVMFPGYRLNVFNYPGSTAMSISGLEVTPKLSQMGSKTYSEFTLQYQDHNGSDVISLVSFNPVQ
jgi:hypothetical protein